MNSRTRDRIAIAVWAAVIACAIFVIAHARFVADLSAFLPTRPTPEQALLIDQLRDGPASHLILIAIDGDGAAVPDATLARLSRATAARLRPDARFLSINNGETAANAHDRELLFEHRYLLSDRVTSARFTVAGLRDALDESLDLLSSSAGMMLQPLLARDPTAELLHLIETLAGGRELPMVDGAWIVQSAEEGHHALLVAETRAAGSDIDGQKIAIEALRTAFDDARREVAAAPASLPASFPASLPASPSASLPSSSATTAAASAPAGVDRAHLVLSGPPVFAVEARDTIEHDAKRLSITGAVLVSLLLGFVYRSPRALVLGLLPMVSGALCGLAAVAVGFGVVHGIALGFGVTLIGEAVDYAIYLFVQGSRSTRPADARGFWATITLGVATSAIGFGALLFSGFQGLAQIGLLSIVGLGTAALVTRWVVPAWLPAGFAVPSMPRTGALLERFVEGAARFRWMVGAAGIAAIAVLFAYRHDLWSRNLSSLSPVSSSALETDGRLRSELGAPDVKDVVVVGAPDEETALAITERVGDALAPLVADGTLVGIESPARYLPSRATQQRRQAALPDDATLRRSFGQALEGSPFVKTGFDGFFADVAREKAAPLLTRADLDRTSLGPAVRALLGTRAASDGVPARTTAVVALRSPRVETEASDRVQRDRIAAALASLQKTADAGVEIRAIDIGTETQDLYAGYLSEALRMAGFGALAIVVLLALTLRDALRLLRIVAPLGIAVLLVAAAHVVLGGPLTLFHFVGLLLIVAVGSNYALFFDRRTRRDATDRAASTADADDRALLVSLFVANLTAVIGFGVLGLSTLPVLHAIGTTVAPGALLALSCAAVFAAREPARVARAPFAPQPRTT